MLFFIFIVINLTCTILTLHSIQWSSPLSTVFSVIVILSVVISAVVVCTVLCCTKHPKIFKLNIESGSSEAAKEFQKCSNNSSCHEDENLQPIYHTIGNRNEELYQEPVPVPPINQINPTFNNPEYHELEQQRDGSNSDSDSENEIDVDVEALQEQTREERELRERRESNRRISAGLEEEERRRSAGDVNVSSITEPQQQEAWFNTLDPSSLCAPAPVAYATTGGTQLHAVSPASTDAHELAVLHNEIDDLYQKKSAVLKETVLTAETSSGDYVDLKDETPAVTNNWYDEGSSSSNHRPRNVTDNVYANASDASPFDDAQYCTVSEARQYTPDVPRRYDYEPV